MSTEYKNKGPVFTTAAKYAEMKTAGTLEIGREYRIIDWSPNEVSVSATGSSTDEVKYITIDGVEKKIGGGGYESVEVTGIANMGALRTFINDINAAGRHCFFDFSQYISGAYVCTVQMYTVSSTNYCYIFDLLNRKIYGSLTGYNDSTTIQAYSVTSANANDIPYVLKITNSNTTLQDVINNIDRVNALNQHVFIDVSALNTSDYLITFTYQTIGSAKRCIAHGLINCTVADKTYNSIASVKLKDFLAGSADIVQYVNNIGTHSITTITSAGSYIESIIYQNGKYIAVSSGSDVSEYSYSRDLFYSEDGTTWTQVTLPSYKARSNIIYYYGTFYLFESSNPNNYMYSADGENWEYSSNGGTWNYGQIYNLFIYKGNICAFSQKSNEFYLSYTYNPSYGWSMVKDLGYRIRSQKACIFDPNGSNEALYMGRSDGLVSKMSLYSISETYTTGLDNISDLVYANNIMIAIGTGNKCAYSLNGATWQTANMPASKNWKTIVYGYGRFYAFANNHNEAAISVDGINWNSLNLDSSNYEWWSSCVGDGVIMAVNKSSPRTYNVKINVESHLCSGGRDITNIIYESLKNYITIIPQQGTVGKSLIKTTNSTKWDYPMEHCLKYDRDIINETTVTLNRNLASPILYGNNKYVVALEGGYVATSTDGITWSYSSSAVLADRHYIGCYINGKYVLIVTYTVANGYYTSEDGETWTAGNFNTSSLWNNCACSGTRLLVMGDSSSVHYYTDDGINWFTINANFGIIKSLIWHKNQFVFMTATSAGYITTRRVYTSSDALTWYNHDFGQYNNGCYLDVGPQSVCDYVIIKCGNDIWISRDFNTWDNIGGQLSLNEGNSNFVTNGLVAYGLPRFTNMGGPGVQILTSYNGYDWIDSKYTTSALTRGGASYTFAKIIGNRIFYNSNGSVSKIIKIYTINNNITQEGSTLNQQVSEILSPYISPEGTNIKSTSITSGKILTADGDGTCSWQDGGGGNQLYQHTLTLTKTSSGFYYTIKKDFINNVATPYNTIDNALIILQNTFGSNWFSVTGYQSTNEVESSTSTISKQIFQWAINDVNSIFHAYSYYSNGLKQETGIISLDGGVWTAVDHVIALQ